ncbi:hypothetical protein [Cerasicoccus maritimus]|uniref:hypothetical protein n=1 Tax=Cerasicoccus maritimus TaxID=490089 RepID=UPI00285289AD|nr:hypothetical protein [Cerasicoccus maritimus]
MINWLQLITLLFPLLLIVLHVWLALYIFFDAKVFRNRQGLFLDSPALWGLMTLISGIIGAAFYWLVHYSTLRKTISS